MVAQRSRRVLNLGLVGAILAAVVVVWIAADAQSAAAAAGTTSAGTNFTKVASLSDAKNRISATRRLQATGTQQRAWSDARTEDVKSGIDGARSASLSSTAKTQLTAYASAATDVSALLTARDWAGAEKALASEADTGVSATAKAFADTVSNAQMCIRDRASRFRTTIDFDDYTDDELRRIFAQMAAKACLLYTSRCV